MYYPDSKSETRKICRSIFYIYGAMKNCKIACDFIGVIDLFLLLLYKAQEI